MTKYKSPGVHVNKSTLASATIVELKTAVPAFVGYTEIAKDVKDEDLRLIPTKIASIREYECYFGGPQKSYPNVDGKRFTIDITKDENAAITYVNIFEPELVYTLFYAIKMFFDNGGIHCYIVSVAPYNVQSPKVFLEGTGQTNGLINGLDVLKKQDDVTLLVIPEAVNLDEASYEILVHEMLDQCNTLQDRFSVLDVYSGDKKLNAPQLSRSRTKFGKSLLKFGAAYYPFLKTNINYQLYEDDVQVNITEHSNTDVALGSVKESLKLSHLKEKDISAYNAAIKALNNHYVVLPPSSSVVGVYAATDSDKGVWKAPANISLNNIFKPVVKIDNALQSLLNVDEISGKSINSLRAFSWENTMIWGARTLAGNDNEWRYVSVRRLYITIETSIKKSTRWAVFEPNDANTWIKLENIIENYLTEKWRQGALVGETPREAFFVRCGLGHTMNSDDIAEGRLNIVLGIAMIRPAEFITIKLTHSLQTP